MPDSDLDTTAVLDADAPAEPESPSDEELTSEEEAQPAVLEEALAESKHRIAELEVTWAELHVTLAQRDEELQRVQAAAEEQDAEAGRLRAQLAQALERLRDALLAANPDIPADLIHGDSVQELDASLLHARELVERVRAQVENRMAQERVPPGTPPRSTPNTATLSPRDKIAYALSRSS